MPQRTQITFAAVAAIVFLYGLHDIVGSLPPNPSVLLVPSIIPAIGVVIAVPLWLAAMRASIRRRAWWWFVPWPCLSLSRRVRSMR